MAVNQGSRSTVLVVGDSFVDVLAGPLPNLPTFGTNTVSPEPIAALPGGSALNVACNLQRLRGGTALFTGVGRDAFGEIQVLDRESDFGPQAPTLARPLW